MKKMIAGRILLLSLFFFVTAAQSAAKSWTVLVYLAGANDLDQFIQQNENQLQLLGSNENVNFLIYESTHYTGKNKETRKLYVNKGSLRQDGPTIVRDSGSVATLKEALEWACKSYPSDRLAVVLWDHGSGPLNREPFPSANRGVCYDFDTGNYLTDRDLLNAFVWTRDTLRQGKKIDILAFDACLMASMELAATLALSVNYFVASEESIPGYGYDYYRAFNIFNTQVPDALTLAKRMVAAYGEAYKSWTDYTLSALDLQMLAKFTANFKSVAQVLTKQLQGVNRSAAKSTIKKAASALFCPCFNEVYIDVLQFYKNISFNIKSFKMSPTDEAAFQSLLYAGMDMFPTFVKANVTGINYARAGGMTIYFDPRGVDASYPKLYWSDLNGWWLTLLRAYQAAR